VSGEGGGLGEGISARLEEAAAVLRRGGIVVYPTETFYAVGARADDGEALARLLRAKLRPAGKPLPLLAADRTQVARLAVLEGAAALVASRLWPGPLTLVLPALASADPALTAGTGTVGIRIPGSAVARELAARAGCALVSTSANPSGGAPPRAVAELAPALLAQVDGVLDAGRTPGGAPSTVVRVEGLVVTVLRQGAVPIAEVVAALG